MVKQRRTRRIKFDPNDWVSISELCRRYKEFDMPWEGQNNDGEPIMISINKDNIVVDTYQSNGWTRQNIYYLEDHSVEELYSR